VAVLYICPHSSGPKTASFKSREILVQIANDDKKQRENRLEIQEVHENFMLKRSILLNFKITVLKFVVIFVLS